MTLFLQRLRHALLPIIDEFMLDTKRGGKAADPFKDGMVVTLKIPKSLHLIAEVSRLPCRLLVIIKKGRIIVFSPRLARLKDDSQATSSMLFGQNQRSLWPKDTL